VGGEKDYVHNSNGAVQRHKKPCLCRHTPKYQTQTGRHGYIELSVQLGLKNAPSDLARSTKHCPRTFFPPSDVTSGRTSAQRDNENQRNGPSGPAIYSSTFATLTKKVNSKKLTTARRCQAGDEIKTSQNVHQKKKSPKK